MQRLFLAIEPPCSLVSPLLARLAGHPAGVRVVPVEQFHLTLHFLGEQPATVRDHLCEELAAVNWQPFRLSLGQPTVFPTRGRPRGLWLTVLASAPLTQLHSQCAAALVRRGLVPESRPFTPHLTLARFRDHPPRSWTAQILTNWPATTPKPFSVTAFHLVASDRLPTGPRHQILQTFHATVTQ